MAMTPQLCARLDQFVLRAGALYSLPRVAVEVLELTSDAVVDTAKLRQCIENDPALTAKLLRVVNSSLFGLYREVADLNQALALLGTKPLKLLVLGFSLPEALFVDVDGEFLSRYWHHTLIKAVAARELALWVRSSSGDEAFIAGLLQDLGMLVLIQQVGEPYWRFLARMQARGLELIDAERLAIGFDHTQLTARLLAHWRLPAAIVDAAAATSAESISLLPPGKQALPRILYAAERLARFLVERKPERLPPLLDALKPLGIADAAALTKLACALQSKAGQLASVLSLQLPNELSYDELLTKAYQRLSAAACQAAAEMIGRAGHEATPDDELLSLDETRQFRESFAALARLVDSNDIARQRNGKGRGVAAAGPCASRRQSDEPIAEAAVAMAEEHLDETLLEKLARSVAACRQMRCPVTLMMIEVDGFDALQSQVGAACAAEMLTRLRDTCQRLDAEGIHALASGDGRLVLLLADYDRQEAVQLGRQWQQIVRDFAIPGWKGRRTLTISIGAAALAQVPRNFPMEELLAAAERSLSGARASGGNSLKSIDL